MLKSLIKPLVFFLLENYTRIKLKLDNDYLIILMYHRVLPIGHPELEYTEPGMYVTPESLDMHIKTLKKYGKFVSLRDYIKCRREGSKVPEKAIAITFDDGWYDNYEYAFPVLKQNNVNACIYLTSGMIDTDRLFWPERLVALLKSPILHETYHLLSVSSRQWLAEIGVQENFGDQLQSKEFLNNIIRNAKRKNDLEINKILDEIFERTRELKCLPPRAVLNWDEYIIMRDSGLVEAGSHTCNHIRLNGQVDVTVEENEIVGSKIELEEKTGEDIVSFCFPNGDYITSALDKVKQHYLSSVTTERGINYFPRDFHLLKRISIHQSITDTKQKFLSKISCLI